MSIYFMDFPKAGGEIVRRHCIADSEGRILAAQSIIGDLAECMAIQHKGGQLIAAFPDENSFLTIGKIYTSGRGYVIRPFLLTEINDELRQKAFAPVPCIRMLEAHDRLIQAADCSRPEYSSLNYVRDLVA